MSVNKSVEIRPGTVRGWPLYVTVGQRVVADIPGDDEADARPIAEFIAAAYRGGWQPVSTAPKDGTWVLLTGPGRWHALACWDHHGWYTGDTFVDEPLWWMPLPEPPEEQEEWHPVPEGYSKRELS